MSRRLTVLVALAVALPMATRVHAQIPVIDVAHLTQAVLIAQRAQRSSSGGSTASWVEISRRPAKSSM